MKKVLTLIAVLFLLSASTTLAQNLCDSYHDKYRVCVEARDAGSNLDIAVCATYTTQSACENANCFWNDQGLPAPGVCTVDVCLADMDFSGRITGADLTAIKKDLGRVSCPCGPYSADLCLKYFEKYTCCIDLRNTGSNLNLADCLSHTNQTDCENDSCFWNDQGLPAPGVCVVDVCLADTSFDSRITGADLTVLKRDLGRVTTCPCNP